MFSSGRSCLSTHKPDVLNRSFQGYLNRVVTTHDDWLDMAGATAR